jgi:hypothetical protein
MSVKRKKEYNKHISVKNKLLFTVSKAITDMILKKI